jgi:hypothetical protein
MDTMNLTPAEEQALADMCSYWAMGSTHEWENVADVDAGDVNLSEVWSDGCRFVQEEAMHEELALGGNFSWTDGLTEEYGSNGEILSSYTPEPTEKMVRVMNMGERYIHARSPEGDAYINPKLTNIVNVLGGVGSLINVKLVKKPVGDESAFPLKVIHINIPEDKQVIVDVNVCKSRKHDGTLKIHGGSRTDNGEKVWIDKFYTNIVFSASHHPSTFKMRLIKNDRENFPWKASFIWPSTPDLSR